jgi:hypothetical protein
MHKSKFSITLTFILFAVFASHISTSQTIVINEINADSPTSTETNEFVELFGPANASLNGYTLAFCEGTDQTYYYSINLNNQSLDANGFFVIGSIGMSNVDMTFPINTIQNGYDAIALYNGQSNLYNVGNNIVPTNLVDVAIYETADANINALNIALGFTATSYVAFNESNGTTGGDLSQSRIPDGGTALTNSNYQNRTLSPGTFNSPPAQLSAILFNEINADNPGNDVSEFIELIGPANASLNGYALAFCDGTTMTYDTVMYLNGYSLDENGFFVAGNSTVDNVDLVFGLSSMGNGTDAVALYFQPNLIFEGDAIVGTNLEDAVVYTTGDVLVPALVSILGLDPNYVVLDETPPTEDESLSRVPDGGTPFDNTTYVMQLPTPGTWNSSDCSAGNPQLVDGSTAIGFCLGGTNTITLDAFPGLETGTFILTDSNGIIVSEITSNTYTFGNAVGEFQIYSIGYSGVLDVNTIAVGQSILNISSSDCINISTFFISVSITDCGALASMVINELNADNPGGPDSEEFIELYGPANASLNGLVVVFLGGTTGTIYDAIDLDGYTTDENGFFVLGNAATTNVDYIFPDAHIQNGPDGIAIFAADASDYPINSIVGPNNLIDAMIYQTDDVPAENLIMNLGLDLLSPPYEDFNETTQATGGIDLTQSRFPDGGPTLTSSNIQLQPLTPGTFNNGVFVNEISEVNGFKIFPNPSQNSFTVSFASTVNEAIQVRVTDITGKTIHTENRGIQIGKNTFTLPSENWSNGMYILQINKEETSIQLQLMKN